MDTPTGKTLGEMRSEDRCLLCSHKMDDHTVMTEERSKYAVTTVHAIGWRCPSA